MVNRETPKVPQPISRVIDPRMPASAVGIAQQGGPTDKLRDTLQIALNALVGETQHVVSDTTHRAGRGVESMVVLGQVWADSGHAFVENVVVYIPCALSTGGSIVMPLWRIRSHPFERLSVGPAILKSST